MIKKIRFQSQELSLEGILYLPESEENLPAIIVCHPHPDFGGSMDNNVVNAVCDKVYKSGISALKFNFRGVGISEGKSTGGKEEHKDVLSAFNFLIEQEKIDKNRIGIVGYSFGAYVGLKAGIDEERIEVLVGISPPITFFDFYFLKNESRPKFFVIGENDSFVQIDKFKIFFETLQEPKSYKIISSVDHFWIGKEEELSKEIYKFLVENL